MTTADVRVVSGKAQVFLGPEATTVAWHPVLAQKSPITLTAPKSVAWAEVWRMDIGPIGTRHTWGFRSSTLLPSREPESPSGAPGPGRWRW